MTRSEILKEAVMDLWEWTKILFEKKEIKFIQAQIANDRCLEIYMTKEDAEKFMEAQAGTFNSNTEVVCSHREKDSLVSIYYLDNDKEISEREALKGLKGV